MASANSLTAKDWFEQGYARKRAGDDAGALAAFRNSIKINPQVAAPWIGIAQLLEDNNQLEEARECLKRAVLADPNFLAARLCLARAHKNLGYVEDARRQYELALELAPDSAAAHFGLGQLFEDLGQPEQAAKAYRQGLSLDPSQYESLACLLDLGRYLDISAEINRAQSLLGRLGPQEKALIGYGLGKAYEQQKKYRAAFEAYEIANAARREVAGPFNRKAFDARVDRVLKLFSGDFFKRRQGWGEPSQCPVFIVGLPRSGTTLTEQILSSHPDCFGAGELNTLTDLATGTPDRLGKAEPSWPDCAPALTKRQTLELGRDYLLKSGLRAQRQFPRVVDKQPLNFWHLGLIAMALPNARIIHCKRDIRDCGFSIFSHNFNAQQSWSTDLEDIAHYWRGYQRLMQHWATVTDLRILDLNYEETVFELNGVARSLVDFLDLPWDDRVVRFHENDRAVQTPSRWQVRQPVYKSSMARWRHYEGQLAPLAKLVERSE